MPVPLAAAADLGVPLILHPYYVGARPGLADFYLTNLIGNPPATTIGAARPIFSGALAGQLAGTGLAPADIELIAGRNAAALFGVPG
jgi:hypothetical protein